MAIEFCVDLGNGEYLDSTGALTNTPPDGKAAFKLPAPLPVSAAALTKAFKGFETILPNLSDAGVWKQFESISMPSELVDLFGKAVKIVEALASVVPIVNIAVGLANVLGLFGSGDNAMKSLIEQEFNKLFARLDQIQRDNQMNYIAGLTGVFSPSLDAVDAFRAEISNPYASPDEKNRKRQEMANWRAQVETKLTDALRHTWTMPFHAEDYQQNWGHMLNHLQTQPVPADGAPQYVGFPAQAEPFDHRPMVSLLIYGIQTYLTLIKAITPEYRTTGQYAQFLKDRADDLALRLNQMRRETLARTVYLSGEGIDATSGFFGLDATYHMPVGALDLRADTDQYLASPDALAAAATHKEPDRIASLNRSWTPPPGVSIGTLTMWDAHYGYYTLSAQAASLANQQSERDYSEVLARSGYLMLAHLEALMRHLATEPDRSETVTASATVWRKPQAGTSVTVRDDKIPFSAPIEATAMREPQQCEADIFLTTQTVPPDESIGYRIRLITLPEGTPFDSYAWTRYAPDGASRNWTLEINENSGMPLDPVGANNRLLADSASPTTPLHKQGTLTLTADTFDWYIPVAPIAHGKLSPVTVAQAAVGAKATGAAGPKPFPAGPFLDPAAPRLFQAVEVAQLGAQSGYSRFISWEEAGDPPNGQKRERERKPDVEIAYDLYWNGSQLSITLKNRPQDRNYTVYVVVEEYLKHSRQWLRTAVQVRMNGQLTYVPQSFFDAEAAAGAHAADILHRFVRARQPKPGEPVAKPGDPVIRWLTPGVLETTEGMQRLVQLAEQYAPEQLQQAIRQEQKHLHKAAG